ncbi:MAG: rhodanese-like domain-containing protein [Planctomycetaceae bacterium]
MVDVRTPVEFRELHVEFARNLPLDQLDPAKVMQARNGAAGEPLYVICKSGGRGEQACRKVPQAGFTNVINVEGGTLACGQAGLPMVRGQKAMSLERQVRMSPPVPWCSSASRWAGSCIPRSSDIGVRRAGLVIFAGITDTCGMGMLLARMPWNQCSTSGATCIRTELARHSGKVFS